MSTAYARTMRVRYYTVRVRIDYKSEENVMLLSNE